MISSLPGRPAPPLLRDEQQARRARRRAAEGDRVDVGVSRRTISCGLAAGAVEADHLAAVCGQVAAHSVPSGAKARLPTRMSLKWRNVPVTGRRPRCRCRRRRRSGRCPARRPAPASGRRRTAPRTAPVVGSSCSSGPPPVVAQSRRARRAPGRRSGSGRVASGVPAAPPSGRKRKSWLRAGAAAGQDRAVGQRRAMAIGPMPGVALADAGGERLGARTGARTLSNSGGRLGDGGRGDALLGLDEQRVGRRLAARRRRRAEVARVVSPTRSAGRRGRRRAVVRGQRRPSGGCSRLPALSVARARNW